MSEPVPIWPAWHWMMERRKGRRVWEQINCHLTEIPSSIVAAFPISKECAPVQATVQAVQGTLQTVDINWRSLVIIFRLSMIDRSRSWFRARQLNFNEWAIGLQKEWQWSVGGRHSEKSRIFFLQHLWLVTLWLFYVLSKWRMGKVKTIVDVGYAVIDDASLDEFAVLYQKLNWPAVKLWNLFI